MRRRFPSELRKQQIQSYIAEYNDSYGFSPSYREIGDAIGLHSVSTVHHYIQELIDDGTLNAREALGSRKVVASRSVSLHNNSSDIPQRIQLNLADGGMLCFDCNVKPRGRDGYQVSFSGIVEVNGMKGHHGRVISCQLESEAL